MLWLTWTSALVLMVTSLAVMVFLVVRRMLRERRTTTDAAARRLVMSALIRFTDTKDAQVLANVLALAPPSVVADAGSEFLGLVRGDDHAAISRALMDFGLLRFLRRELKGANEARRLQAVEILAAFPADLAAPLLHQALSRDRSHDVRLSAAIALADRNRLPPLGEVLPMIGSGGQRSRRLIELFRKHPADRSGDLQAVVRDLSASSFMRAAAIEALSQQHAMAMIDLFIEVSEDPSAEVSAAAIRALGRTGHRRTLPIIAGGLVSDHWEVRLEAAEAAGRLGELALLHPLLELLDDSSWPVRHAAGRAVRLLGSEGESALRDLARTEGSRVQRMASLALAEGVAA